MTQIRSVTHATRRSGELGVHSLDAFNLIVPDMKQAESFYSLFGLDLQARGNRLDVHTFGNRHRWVFRDWKGNCDFETLPDTANPGDMRKQAIDGQCQQVATKLLKFGIRL